MSQEQQRVREQLTALESRLTAIADLGVDISAISAGLGQVRDQIGAEDTASAARLLHRLSVLAEAAARGQVDHARLGHLAAAASAHFYENRQLDQHVRSVVQEEVSLQTKQTPPSNSQELADAVADKLADRQAKLLERLEALHARLTPQDQADLLAGVEGILTRHQSQEQLGVSELGARLTSLQEALIQKTKDETSISVRRAKARVQEDRLDRLSQVVEALPEKLQTLESSVSQAKENLSAVPNAVQSAIQQDLQSLPSKIDALDDALMQSVSVAQKAIEAGFANLEQHADERQTTVLHDLQALSSTTTQNLENLPAKIAAIHDVVTTSADQTQQVITAAEHQNATRQAELSARLEALPQTLQETIRQGFVSQDEKLNALPPTLATVLGEVQDLKTQINTLGQNVPSAQELSSAIVTEIDTSLANRLARVETEIAAVHDAVLTNADKTEQAIAAEEDSNAASQSDLRHNLETLPTATANAVQESLKQNFIGQDEKLSALPPILNSVLGEVQDLRTDLETLKQDFPSAQQLSSAIASEVDAALADRLARTRADQQVESELLKSAVAEGQQEIKTVLENSLQSVNQTSSNMFEQVNSTLNKTQQENTELASSQIQALTQVGSAIEAVKTSLSSLREDIGRDLSVRLQESLAAQDAGHLDQVQPSDFEQLHKAIDGLETRLSNSYTQRLAEGVLPHLEGIAAALEAMHTQLTQITNPHPATRRIIEPGSERVFAGGTESSTVLQPAAPASDPKATTILTGRIVPTDQAIADALCDENAPTLKSETVKLGSQPPTDLPTHDTTRLGNTVPSATEKPATKSLKTEDVLPPQKPKTEPETNPFTDRHAVTAFLQAEEISNALSGSIAPKVDLAGLIEQVDQEADTAAHPLASVAQQAKNEVIDHQAQEDSSRMFQDAPESDRGKGSFPQQKSDEPGTTPIDRLALETLARASRTPSPSTPPPQATLDEDDVRRMVRRMLPELLAEEPVKQKLFLILAVEAITRPSALGELTGLRRFLSEELERIQHPANQ